eukprot:3116325-Alexandrium_andersonii.AAC.1
MHELGVAEDLTGDGPRAVAEDIVLDGVERAPPSTKDTRMGLLEAARSGASVPEHREVREADPRRE